MTLTADDIIERANALPYDDSRRMRALAVAADIRGIQKQLERLPALALFAERILSEDPYRTNDALTLR